MDQIWGKFCNSLDMKYWDQAQEMWQKLDEDGASVNLLQADTKDRFQNSFQFEEVGRNDRVVEILEPLEIAQKEFKCKSQQSDSVAKVYYVFLEICQRIK